jgi:CRISPR-associated protein Cpf1
MNTFTGQYAVSKTLRARLRPVGKTKDTFGVAQILAHDEKRAEDYKAAKTLIDGYHKRFIEDALKTASLDWDGLSDAIKAYRRDKDRGKLETAQKKYRAELAAVFQKDARFGKLFKKELFTELLKPSGDSEKQLIETFKRFSTYFTGFHENRKNIYSAEDQRTAVSHRVVHDNFPKFLTNLGVYAALKDKCPSVLAEAEQELAGVLQGFGVNLGEVFAVPFFNRLLTQKGIDFFNTLVGGRAGEAGTRKIRGINECATQYWQEEHAEFAKTNRRVTMLPLYKQILSDRESLSFVPQEFSHNPNEGDKQVWDSVAQFYKVLSGKCAADKNGEPVNHFAKLKTLANPGAGYELSGIYIRAKDFAFVSSLIFKRWNALKDALKLSLEQKAHPSTGENPSLDLWGEELRLPLKNTRALNPKEKKALKADEFDETKIAEEFSVEELNALLPLIPDAEHEDRKIVAAIQKELFEEITKNIDRVERAHSVLFELKDGVNNAALPLREQTLDISRIKSLSVWKDEKRETVPIIELIKSLLDSIQDLLHLLAVFESALPDKDTAFYGDFDAAYNNVRNIIPLYNKVRNYLTRKPSDEGKIKLNFEKSTLAAGWDLNKESANFCMIFERDGKYYLGVLNKNIKAKERPVFPEKPEDECIADNEAYYRKMVYKLLPGPNKMLSKVFFPKNPPVPVPPEILEGYAAGKHKKGDAFDKAFCHKLIDFFKTAIPRYPGWDGFDFHFTPTAQYEDISEFYREVTEQGYKINFVRVPVRFVDGLVETGKLYLFQIYNKDFAAGAKGAPNLHTLYFKHIFSPENRADVVIKLSGEAELFYRKASIKNPVRHAPGEKMVNRWYVDENGKNQPLPDKAHKELFEYVNKRRKENELSDEVKPFKERLCEVPLNNRAPSGKIAVKTVTHDLVKDRRFTEDTFLFHFPVTLNFKAPASPAGFNRKALERLRSLAQERKVKIIGIDRGERHLLYVSLIDLRGNIIEQKSLNIVESNAGGEKRRVNYHGKLAVREKERDAARKNWQTIGKIKELKAGYLSLVIHEISKMAVEHNAIVVLEDLNLRFMQRRGKFEKNVYQKFEETLINKLNYLAFKGKDPKEPGGVLNAYQLTAPFTSFKELGKQSGWLFYVPAAYTSKIDPETGFANHFQLKGLTNIEKKKDFFSKFDDIRYDRETDSFAFSFCYGNFSEESAKDDIKQWTVYTQGERIVYGGKNQPAITVNPTENLKDCFSAQGISWQLDESLKDAVATIPTEKSNAPFFDALYRGFVQTLQMRNSDAETGEDYIISPVKNASGVFFDSRDYEKMDKPPRPKDADANGAYHIALKGLYLLHYGFPEEKGYLKRISNNEWFRFAEEKPYRK